MRLGSAKEGDRIRALDGIDRDPDWQKFPEDMRPIPGHVYTIEGVGECVCCGEPSFRCKEFNHPIIAHDPDVPSVTYQSFKAEWFTTEGARLQ